MSKLGSPVCNRPGWTLRRAFAQLLPRPCLSVLCVLIATTITPAQELRALKPGETIDKEIAGGSKHTYSVTFAGGQIVRLTLQEKRLNLGLELRSATGDLITKSHRHGVWAETILYEPSKPGVHHLVVTTPDLSLNGSYRLLYEVQASATEQDRLRIEAGRIAQEAYDLSQSKAAAAAQEATEKAQQAVELWERAGDQNGKAYALTTAAIANRYLGQHAKTLALANDAIAIFRQERNAAGESLARRAAGVAYALQGQPVEAVESLQKALELDKVVDNLESQAGRYADLGATYVTMSRPNEAIDALQNSVALSRRLNAASQEASALSNLARLKTSQGRVDESVADSSRAVEIFRKLGDRYLEGIALLTWGDALQFSGDFKGALQVYERSLAIRQELKDPDGIASSLEFIGSVNVALGRYDEAIARYKQAQAIRDKTDGRTNRVQPLASLGKIYMQTNDFDKALDNYQQALKVSREIRQPALEADVLHSLADLYNVLGQDDRAFEYAQRSLKMYRDIKVHRETNPLQTLGDISFRRGQYEQSIGYLTEMLTLARQAKSKGQEASALIELARVLFSTGKHEEAVAHLRSALAISRQIEEPNIVATALTQLGAMYIELSKFQDAREPLLESLRIYRNFKNDPDTIIVLRHLANAERLEGKLIEARKTIEEALQLAESQRSRMYNPALRMSWFVSVQNANQLYIDILMRLHREQPDKQYDVLAFEAAERGRARALLDLLRESASGLRQGADPELQRRERQLAHQINALEAERSRLIASGRRARLEPVSHDIEELRTQYEQLQGELRSKDPRYARLTQSAPLTLKELQRELDNDTLLLEYSLGKERSYLWLIGRASFRVFELPKEDVIETSARRVYELVTARGRAARMESRAALEARIKAADEEFYSSEAELSRMILGPVWAELDDKRLVIISDGALDYLPFQLLSESSASSGRPSRYRPLVLRHEVVILPSASAMVVQRRELAGRKIGSKLTAIFADPVFTGSDVRIGATTLAVDSVSRELSIEDTRVLEHLADTPAGPSAGILRISRLPYTSQEAKRIAALVPANQRFEAFGFEATREKAMSSDLTQYKYVHFATHGWMDSLHPERSALVLSLIDAKGNPQDGFLRLSDIYNLRLPAELVTLSACQTGLGKQVKGEGLVGLTRGFLYAGAARVAVSHWNVNDEATADLMAAFYRGILKHGLSPAAALRAAQIRAMAHKRWQSPYYWAAFTLHGEWR